MGCVAYVITHKDDGLIVTDYDDETGDSICIHGSPDRLPEEVQKFMASHERRPTGKEGDWFYFDLRDGRRAYLTRAIMEWVSLWWPEIEWRLTDASVSFAKKKKRNSPAPCWVGLNGGRVVVFAAPAFKKKDLIVNQQAVTQ